MSDALNVSLFVKRQVWTASFIDNYRPANYKGFLVDFTLIHEKVAVKTIVTCLSVCLSDINEVIGAIS